MPETAPLNLVELDVTGDTLTVTDGDATLATVTLADFPANLLQDAALYGIRVKLSAVASAINRSRASEDGKVRDASDIVDVLTRMKSGTFTVRDGSTVRITDREVFEVAWKSAWGAEQRSKGETFESKMERWDALPPVQKRSLRTGLVYQQALESIRAARGIEVNALEF